jgi:hypothetical protein
MSGSSSWPKNMHANKLGAPLSISIAVCRKLDILYALVLLALSSSFKPLLRHHNFSIKNVTFSISTALTMKLLLLAALLATLLVRHKSIHKISL